MTLNLTSIRRTPKPAHKLDTQAASKVYAEARERMREMLKREAMGEKK